MSCSTLPGGDPQPRDYPLATLDAFDHPPALAAQLDVGPVQFTPRQRKTFDAGESLGAPLAAPTLHLPMTPTPVRRGPGRGAWVGLVVAVIASGVLGGWLAVHTFATPATQARADAAEVGVEPAQRQPASVASVDDLGPRETATLAAADAAAWAIAEAVDARTAHIPRETRETPAARLARVADAMKPAPRATADEPPTKRAAAAKVAPRRAADREPERARRDAKPEPRPRKKAAAQAETDASETGTVRGLAVVPDAAPAEAPTLEDAFGGLTTGSEAAERRKLAQRRQALEADAPASDEVESLSRSEITAAVRGVYGKVRACEASADVSGKLVVKFDVMGNGRVRNARVASREFFDSRVGACVANVLEGMTLRETGATEPRSITYPFHIAAK